MTAPSSSAAREWRTYPMLPIAAALGYASSIIHIYGLSPYIEPIAKSFDWSRTQVTIGLTVATIIQALFAVPIGMAVDRFGPRRLGLIGVLLACAAFAFIGFADGGETNWAMHWAIMAVAVLPVQATIWASAVASRFSAARGLALAVTLSGASAAQALFPWLGTVLINQYGWQKAMAVQAAIWVVVAWPIIFLFFRGAQDRRKNDDTSPEHNQSALSGVSVAEGMRSTVYLRLWFASMLFTFTILGLNVHFVLILQGEGFPKLGAAGIASLIGLSSIAGRLGTGLLLDRFRGSLVGAAAFLLPAIACLVLVTSGSSQVGAMGAAVLIGLTLGAEVDVIVYLTTRHFGLRHFGTLYGGLLVALSLGTAFGPLAASRIYDLYGTYDPFLWGCLGLLAASSLALASLPQPPAGEKKL